MGIFKKERFNKGFTAIELLAVVAILSIMMAVAWPRLSSLTRYNLEGAARGLAGDLRLIRQEAITSGLSCSINFRTDETRYQLRLPGGKRSWVYLPAGVSFLGKTTFPDDPSPPSVSFNKLGRPSSGGTVILQSTSGEKRYVVVLPVTGRVRVSEVQPAHW